MSCIATDIVLVEGVDYELDVVNGRIRFKSTGTLGPTLDTFLAGGGCGVEVDYCGSMPLHIPCPSKINECLPCDDDPILNISAEAPDSDRFLFNFNQRQRPPLAFRFEQLGCKRWCWSDVSQQDADLCAIRQVEECLNDALFGGGSLIPPFPPPQSPALFFNTAQVCTTFCPDGTSFGAVIQAGLVEDRNQVQADRIAHALACRLSALERVCIRTKELPPSCLGDFYSLQLMGLGGIPFHVTFDNFDTLSAMCGTDVLQPNDSFPYIWSATGLPTGLSLSPCSGILSGTPTQSGSFQVTLRAQDALGSFQTKTLTLTVVGFTDASNLPDATVGVGYSKTLGINPTGTYLFAVISGSPPAWLSLNESTGELSGTPDSPGDFIFTIDVTLQDGSTCSMEFTLAVVAKTILAYWPFEDAPPDYEDSTGNGNTLLLVAGPAPFAAAGIIATGAQLTENGGVGNSTDLECNFVPITFDPNGWTAFGWMNCNFTLLGNASTVGLLTATGGAGASAMIMSLGTAFLGATNRLELIVSNSGPVQNDSVTSQLLANGWNFWVMWWDAATGKTSLQVNNSTVMEIATTWNPGIPINEVGQFLTGGFLSTPAHPKVVDEICVVAKVLSASQRTALYNGGAGVTWPQVRTIIDG